jgi:CheY-like chemotaxis protein
MNSGIVGRRLLIVEDNFNIAFGVAKALDAQGVKIIGPAGTVKEGLSLIQANELIDGAVLDIRLHNTTVYPIVDALRARNVPMVFMTGYDSQEIEQDYADVPCLQKPVSIERLMQALFG